MLKKREISEYRERLDKTLTSHELTNEQTLKTLIRNQLNEECNDDMLDQRVADLFSTLEKLRSVSTKNHQELSKSSNDTSYGDWKLKHDREDCRVMYREGPQGSPFHTLLVEGYIDATIEQCLCVSWESSLYEKWWPKYTFPAFRVLQTKCLQKFWINEQICLVRVKVPWPLTDREALVRFFLFEYLKDGLVIILLNSISSIEEVENIDKNGNVEAVNAVRIDLVGGVAIQKVNSERSYVRFITELDIKLDLVPSSLINFMSRQLLSNGFGLFKKTIGSVAKSDDYSRVLADPLYTRIHQALYSNDKADEEKESKMEADELDMRSLAKDNGFRHSEENKSLLCKRDHEIEEEGFVNEIEDDKSVSSSEDENVIGKTQNYNGERRFCISPEVKQALGILERVISMVRKSRTDKEVCIQDPKFDEASFTHYLNNNNNSNRQSGSSSFAREGNKIVHASSPEIDLIANSEVTKITISQATTLFSQTTEDNNDKPSGLNGSKGSISQRKRKPGCFCFKLWMRKT